MVGKMKNVEANGAKKSLNFVLFSQKKCLNMVSFGAEAADYVIF